MDKNFKQELVSIRRHIHKNPELGNNEFETSSFVQSVLKRHGIASKRIAGTGVVARIDGRKGGGCFAIRADMDALPITEKTAKPYCSVNKGVMHACGHDGNTTMALGAGILLSRQKDRFCGTVKLIFQPNEESSGGALSMIKAGALKDPVVNAITGIHVSPWLRTGVIGLKHGAMMAAVDKFDIEIIGDGGHGAYPHLGKDAIVIASEVINSFQSIVSRETDPVEPVVITVGKMEGGERYNVLCGKVAMTGTVRTLNRQVQNNVRSAIKARLKNITAAYEAKYTLSYEELGPALINSEKILDLCKNTATETFGQKNVSMLEKPSMGGEDFAQYLRIVPGCFVYIGSSGASTGGKTYPWHHEKFDIDEDVLPAGAKFLSEAAIKYLSGK
jgi:amidohydrolase